MKDLIVRARPVIDELVTDEGAVVLIDGSGGHRVARLSVLGQLIRELAVEGISLESLVHELESILGPPTEGDASSLVLSAVAELERDRLVVTGLTGPTRPEWDKVQNGDRGRP